MKKYRIFLIIISALIIILWSVAKITDKFSYSSERKNSESISEERVFDYADVLTDEEENKLRKLIKESEEKIEGDIIIVTIRDTIEDKELMPYADDFYDQGKYGWNMPYGDGVLYLDNWENGYVWLSTSGKFINEYSSVKIDSLIEKTCEHINEDPYLGYETFVKELVWNSNKGTIVFLVASLIIAAIAAITFVIVNVLNRGNEVEPTKSTYVKNGNVDIKYRTDTFINKNVTSRTIQKSSGGSGSHRSSGGRSHGGGGGRH